MISNYSFWLISSYYIYYNHSKFLNARIIELDYYVNLTYRRTVQHGNSNPLSYSTSWIRAVEGWVGDWALVQLRHGAERATGWANSFCVVDDFHRQRPKVHPHLHHPRAYQLYSVSSHSSTYSPSPSLVTNRSSGSSNSTATTSLQFHPPRHGIFYLSMEKSHSHFRLR